MKKEELVFFYNENEAFGEFSPRRISPFRYAGSEYNSMMQYVMYHKMMLFGRRHVANKIMEEKEPSEIKKLGSSQFEGFSTMQWDVISEGIVIRAAMSKFLQNKEMGNLLLSTGDKILVFANPLDGEWGIGMPAGDPLAADPSKWKGKNRLGKLLMEARTQIRLFSLAFGEIPPYIDVVGAPKIDEFDLKPGELRQDPAFGRAINTYMLSLPDQHAKDVFLWGQPLGRMDTNIQSLPRAGFFDMKQEIYDIALLRHQLAGKVSMSDTEDLQE